MTDMTKVLVDKEILDALIASVENPSEATSEVAPPIFPDSRPPIAWGQKVSRTFIDRVWWISDEITKKQGGFYDPNWLMACMAWETGEKFTPDVKNLAGSGATGLIQFMKATAEDLGKYRKVTLTTDMLARMTAEVS